MTSSFLLKKLKEDGRWNVSNHDTYLKINGECHPDYEAAPIGRQTGAKVCTRKPRVALPAEYIHPSANNGYYKGATDLYNPKATFPVREWSPYHYSDMRTPNESDLIKDDYIHIPAKFNGTGIGPLRHSEPGNPYYSFAYSHMPASDDHGLRVGSSKAPVERYTLYSPISGVRKTYGCVDLTRPYNPIEMYEREHPKK